VCIGWPLRRGRRRKAAGEGVISSRIIARTTHYSYCRDWVFKLLIPLCVQYVENIYAKRQARAAFERRILQSLDCKMVSNVRADCEHRPDDANRPRNEVNRGALKNLI